MKDKDPFLLYTSYHGCWWPGATRNQDISSYGNGFVLLFRIFYCQHCFDESTLNHSKFKMCKYMSKSTHFYPKVSIPKVPMRTTYGSLSSNLAPVPLTIFRWTSKLYQIMMCYGLKYTLTITTEFCTCHDSVTVVTCAKFRCDWVSMFKLQHFIFWSNFKFERNTVSGTGTWTLPYLCHCDALGGIIIGTWLYHPMEKW